MSDAPAKRFPWSLVITIALVAASVVALRACATSAQHTIDDVAQSAATRAADEVGKDTAIVLDGLAHQK